MEPTQIKDLIPALIHKQPITASSPSSGWAPRFDAYEPSLIAAELEARRFVAAMERGDDPYWLTLTGVNGCGKSFLGRQIFAEAKRINPGNPANNAIWPPIAIASWGRGANTYTASRPYALWFDEGGLASRMRAGDYNLPRTLRDDFFVGLDEIGATRDPSNFISEAIGSLAEARLNRWSFFATNLTLTEIASRMDARISSRLIRDGNRVVVIKATDYALRG